MSDPKCRHCGGDEGLHHHHTDQCPLGGIYRPGQEQIWTPTTFEPVSDELAQLRAENAALRARLDAMLKALPAKRAMDIAEIVSHLSSRAGIDLSKYIVAAEMPE